MNFSMGLVWNDPARGQAGPVRLMSGQWTIFLLLPLTELKSSVNRCLFTNCIIYYQLSSGAFICSCIPFWAQHQPFLAAFSTEKLSCVVFPVWIWYHLLKYHSATGAILWVLRCLIPRAENFKPTAVILSLWTVLVKSMSGISPFYPSWVLYCVLY